jgi:hypothetical protein
MEAAIFSETASQPAGPHVKGARAHVHQQVIQVDPVVSALETLRAFCNVQTVHVMGRFEPKNPRRGMYGISISGSSRSIPE